MPAAGNPTGLKGPVLKKPEVAIGHRTIGMDLRGENDNPVIDQN